MSHGVHKGGSDNGKATSGQVETISLIQAQNNIIYIATGAFYSCACLFGRGTVTIDSLSPPVLSEVYHARKSVLRNMHAHMFLSAQALHGGFLSQTSGPCE